MPPTKLTKELYFITSTVIDWIDIFTRPAYKNIVVESLQYCQKNKGLEIYAWVLMTNHLHMIVGTCGNYQIGDILRDFKKHTSKTIVKAIEENQQESRKEWLIDKFKFRAANDSKVTNYKFWQEGNHVEAITSYDFYLEKLNYIHMNPVKQEIVDKPEDYSFSSARNYCGEKGLIDVILLI